MSTTENISTCHKNKPSIDPFFQTRTCFIHKTHSQCVHNCMRDREIESRVVCICVLSFVCELYCCFELTNHVCTQLYEKRMFNSITRERMSKWALHCLSQSSDMCFCFKCCSDIGGAYCIQTQHTSLLVLMLI